MFYLITPFNDEYRNEIVLLVIKLANNKNLLSGIHINYSDECGFNLPICSKFNFLNDNQIWYQYHGNVRQLRFNHSENNIIYSLRYKDGIESWDFTNEVLPLVELINEVVNSNNKYYKN